MFNAIVTGFLAVVSFVATVIGRVVSVFQGREFKDDIDDTLTDSPEDVHGIIQQFMKENSIKAGQCAIRVDGSLRLNAGYTWAQQDYSPQTKRDSVFRIASCSKNFTTAAILKLRSQGKINDSDKVFEKIGITTDILSADNNPPDDRVNDITVQHLVEHKGGWNYADANSLRDPVFHLFAVIRDLHLTNPPTKMDFAKWMFHQQLDFDPGAEEHYSNIGYLLLGMVVEAASGLSYIDYLNKEILNNDGISDVFVGATRPGGRRDNEVNYYDPAVGADVTRPTEVSIVPFPYGGSGAMTEVMDSGGGLVTSASSLSKFIGLHNISVNNITDSDGRINSRRDGNMPGSNAISECFSFTDKAGNMRNVDYAIIFNCYRLANKAEGFVNVYFEDMVTAVKEKIQEKFS